MKIIIYLNNSLYYISLNNIRQICFKKVQVTLWAKTCLHDILVITFLIVYLAKFPTLGLSFLLRFIWSVSYIMGILNVLANIHLSASTYHVCQFVSGLVY